MVTDNTWNFSFTNHIYSTCASACKTSTTQNQPQQISNTQRTEKKTTDVVMQQHSRKLLMMDILMSETCWAHKTWNKIASDIKLVFHSSTITMMHGPINIRLIACVYCLFVLFIRRFFKKIYPLVTKIPLPWITVFSLSRITLENNPARSIICL